ncbi:MAG: protein kinase [Myxococcales bacterium]|nr:protein kinase [Myxococcota bacterium]MDW8281465.1 protein kinase [Myxococcales bacterium]
MSLSLVGKRIGNYDIQAKIGEGGMGIVYLGVHPQIAKRVAIKVLHEELSSKADVVSRFFTEARSVNEINHPNIVDIVDFGDYELEGVVLKYIIMEFLDGESLAARIRREGVTIRETMYIMAQCASALAASHAKGVVHRDLKPENIFLLTRGQDRNYVKLLDFGIAKLMGDGGAGMSSRTRTGMVIGTPAYMSPEQCEGRGLIDHRSDIYALGVVMYELLTGRVPFRGDGFGEVLVAHLTRDPEPPSQLNPNLPPEIEALVLHCLRKDKAQRFQSMNEFLAALQDPVAHFQQWTATAHLPPGTATGSAPMSTAWTGSQQSASGPAAPVPPTSGATPWLATVSGPLSPSLALPGGADVPVVTGALPLLPAGGSMQPGPAEPVAAVGTGPRPTTLSGASGEATGSGRRPASVLLMMGGAVALGILATVGVKMARRPRPEPVPAAQRPAAQRAEAPSPAGPAAETVTIQVRSHPAHAEVLRGDSSLGRTPLSLQVKKGTSLDLRLRLAGYDELVRTVQADSDEVVEVSLSKTALAEAGVDPSRKGMRDRGRKERRKDRKKKGKDDGTELLPPLF